MIRCLSSLLIWLFDADEAQIAAAASLKLAHHGRDDIVAGCLVRKQTYL
jgi:hypothetical protein